MIDFLSKETDESEGKKEEKEEKCEKESVFSIGSEDEGENEFEVSKLELFSKENEENRFFKLVEEGNVEGVKEMVNKRENSFLLVSKKQVRSGNWHPLHLAIETANSKEMAEYLVSLGADVNCLTSAECSPLQCAANRGNFEIFQMLVKKGAKVNHMNIKHWTTLHFACLGGNKEIVKMILEDPIITDVKKEVDRRTKGWSWTPLHFACKTTGDTLDIVKLLIEKGANINAVESVYRSSSLHAAALNGATKIVKYLIDKGADVNAKNKKNWTPILFASKFGHFDIVRMLYEKGASLSASTEKLNTCLHFATLRNDVKLTRFLLLHFLEKKVDVCKLENINKRNPKDLTNDKNVLSLFEKSLKQLEVEILIFENK